MELPQVLADRRARVAVHHQRAGGGRAPKQTAGTLGIERSRSRQGNLTVKRATVLVSLASGLGKGSG
jgi:hypothetical protein